MGCSTFPSLGVKLTLIKSVFSSMPIFFMCTLSIPTTVTNQLNKYLKHYFWRKYGTLDKGVELISWEKACMPKTHGGLGILDIFIHNKALVGDI